MKSTFLFFLLNTKVPETKGDEITTWVTIYRVAIDIDLLRTSTLIEEPINGKYHQKFGYGGTA